MIYKLINQLKNNYNYLEQFKNDFQNINLLNHLTNSEHKTFCTELKYILNNKIKIENFHKWNLLSNSKKEILTKSVQNTIKRSNKLIVKCKQIKTKILFSEKIKNVSKNHLTK